MGPGHLWLLYHLQLWSNSKSGHSRTPNRDHGFAEFGEGKEEAEQYRARCNILVTSYAPFGESFNLSESQLQQLLKRMVLMIVPIP